MKILESQAAVLTNYEVFQHVTEQRERYKSAKRRGPPNLETVVREVRLFLKKAQSSEDYEENELQVYDTHIADTSSSFSSTFAPIPAL